SNASNVPPKLAAAATISWHSTHVAVQLTLGPLLATSGGRLYVLGTAGSLGSRSNPIWSSADGTTWEPLPVSGIDSDFVARAAIGDASDGLIVVGELTPSESVVPQIWYAPDGHTFMKAQVDVSNLASGSGAGAGEIVAVAANSGHLVAFGDHDFVSLDKSVGEIRALDAWRSADGKSWARVDLPDSSGYQARSLTAWSGGFAALASQAKDPEYALWTSPDGLAWRKAGSVPAFGVASILALAGRLVVVGSKADTSLGMVPASWSSADGASWTESTAPVSGYGAMFDAAAVVQGGIVAIGASHVGTTQGLSGASASLPPLVPPSSWISNDGSSWRPTGDIQVFNPYLTSMTAFGDRVVVATNAGTDVVVSLGELAGTGAEATGT
ncbi:MAG TPA: hypothetical protein VF349_07140, partial [Candidatus Limnocylindrales bacterium]